MHPYLLTCELCGRGGDLARHHVYFGPYRKHSERYDMVAWLCPSCHQYGARAVHRCRETDLILKKRYQQLFEETHGRAEFMRIFGRNYLI